METIVYFLTGTDENAQKIVRTAESKGMDPKSYVDGIVERFKSLWEELDISNDDFIRTTEERHHQVVKALFTKLHDQGDIYKSEYEGWYCTPCETFWPESKLIDGKCPNPDCGRDVELLKEESYFLDFLNIKMLCLSIFKKILILSNPLHDAMK